MPSRRRTVGVVANCCEVILRWGPTRYLSRVRRGCRKAKRKEERRGPLRQSLKPAPQVMRSLPPAEGRAQESSMPHVESRVIWMNVCEKTPPCVGLLSETIEVLANKQSW